ncbi:hypothetical protein Mx8p06 [Myxococcus phage Mx8]|uniref:p6 n=1 Tax=Myxococcus phage Mx8 TaxID=49964 RepID=O03957_9CAUD|nr:hypothetical protein Mx8p06 [Myxococcus phage Mx8]AAC48901.1 unknown [Myxococcus phage Mx8]AAK94341.1 p6 [Myxococcus phage Mx8]
MQFFIAVMEDNDSVPHRYAIDAVTEDAAREEAERWLPATRLGRGGVTLYRGTPNDENPERIGKVQSGEEGPAWLN